MIIHDTPEAVIPPEAGDPTEPTTTPPDIAAIQAAIASATTILGLRRAVAMLADTLAGEIT